MDKYQEFTASNGFIVKYVPASLVLEVGNVHLNEERAEALYEYFTSSAFTGVPTPAVSPEMEIALNATLNTFLEQFKQKGS